jgi:crossover junction endodeoxyribonuclease RusA
VNDFAHLDTPPDPCTIVLPFPPATLSGHAKGHWRSKHGPTKQWRERAAKKAAALCLPDLGDAKPYEPGGDIRLRITFVPPDRRGDRVNFPNRMKPIFDGIADALGVNDARFVPILDYRPPQKPGWVAIEVIP